MGQAKKDWINQITGYSESINGINFNGRIYINSSDNNGYINYSIINCSICNEKMVQKYEKDETPGFRDSSCYIVDRTCNCK